MREGVHILSNKAFAVPSVETLRMLHVLRLRRVRNTGIAFPCRKSKNKKQLQLITIGKVWSFRKPNYLEENKMIGLVFENDGRIL